MLPVVRYNLKKHCGLDVPYWEHYFALPDEAIGQVHKACSTLWTDYVPDSLWNRYIRRRRYVYNLFVGENGVTIARLDLKNSYRIQTNSRMFDDPYFCQSIRKEAVFKQCKKEIIEAYYRDLPSRIQEGKEAVLIIPPYRIEVSRRKFIVYDKKGNIVADRLCDVRYNSEMRRLVINSNAKKRIWLDVGYYQNIVKFFENYPTHRGCEDERSLWVQWVLAVTALIVAYISTPLIWLGVSLFVFAVVFKKFTLAGALIAVIATIIIHGLLVEWMKDRWI